ncbi:MAG: DUF58 domain-containing protein [Phycisphaerales bacterium]|nr:DUF58 domain-containing protein [Phycisphaerales bacterium]
MQRGLLDPKILARIGSLELRARLAVEGYFSGMHRSPFPGVSIEFADHRAYTQGDDIRHVDWKVYGRTDKYYIKRYEQETNLNCMVLVDDSESMTYRSADVAMTKRQYAASMAAAVAYLALRQRDAVGLVVFDETITRFIRPSNHPAHWRHIVQGLAAHGAGRKTGVRPVLDDLAERLPRRTLLILISDLFGDVEETLMGLKRLRYQRHEAVVFNVWDPAELNFPFKGPTRFEGLESTGRLLTQPEAMRSQYLAEVARFVESLRRGCRDMQIEWTQFDTSTPLDAAISTYLVTRSARLRQRSSRVLGGR